MYQALYRKYRPQIFDEVVGQEAVIKILKNSIINNKIGHAYMFFGPRGIGKTTISKIFARTINCLEPIDGNSCGKCKNCLYSYEKECVDIIEMDAASNNGVDEIRELRNKISLVPAELKYKVYIIDEVHMLSIGAFNALLKTLEEPPKHAIFILATTDPQKVPETIISRCQTFSFNRISDFAIIDRLKGICSIENIDVDDEVLEDIALASDGGLRDALGSLDKLTSFTSEKITYDDYITVNNLITKNDISKFADNILIGNISYVLENFNKIYSSGKDVIQVISKVMYYVKDLVVNYYLNDIVVSFDIINASDFVTMINEKMFDIKKSDNPKIYIEILLLQFMGSILNDDIKEVKSNTFLIAKEYNGHSNNDNNNINNNNFDISIEDKKKNENISDVVEKNEKMSTTNSNSNIRNIMNIRVNNTLAMADKKILTNEIENRMMLNDYTFDQEVGYLVCEILNSKFRVASENTIVISYEYDSIVEQNLSNIEKMVDVYKKITNSTKNFAIISDEQWNKFKDEYILSVKSGKKYVVEEEPNLILDEEENNDIITNSAVELFGDIVEIE